MVAFHTFLHNGSLAMFERQGFVRMRQIGEDHWVVVKTLRRARAKTAATQGNHAR